MVSAQGSSRAVHIVVLAKVPVAGHAKTRLAPALGVEGAARLALKLLDHALTQVVEACHGEPGVTPSVEASSASDAWRVGRLSAELCVAPAPGHALWDGGACLPSLRVTDQGDGDLGQRMARACQRVLASGASVLLMGTDCPTLTAPLLRESALRLQDHDAVVIPAFDGGYVLLGLRRYLPAVFEHMPWSTADVARLTVQRLEGNGFSVWRGPMLHDVDEPADLGHLPPDWAVSPS